MWWRRHVVVFGRLFSWFTVDFCTSCFVCCILACCHCVQLHLDHVSLLGLPDKVNLKWNTQHTGSYFYIGITTATSFLTAWLLHNNILFISWLMSENAEFISKHASEIPEKVSVVLLGLHQCLSPQNKESTSNETQRTQQVIVLCYLSISCPKIDELMFTFFSSNSEHHLIHLPPGDSNKSWRPKFRVSLRFKSQHFSLRWRVTNYMYSTCIRNLYSNTSLM